MFDFLDEDLLDSGMKIRYTHGDFTKPHGKGHMIMVLVCDLGGKWESAPCLAVKSKYRKAYKEYYRWQKEGKKGTAATPWRSGSVKYIDVTKRGWIFNTNPTDIFEVALLLGIDTSTNRGAYSSPVNIAAIKKGLQRIASYAFDHDASIHMPKIGTAKGEGGRWKVIREVVQAEILTREVPVTVYDVDDD